VIADDLRSVLLVRAPTAEAAVGAHRARLDPSARDGVPAHLTVLYPFLPPAEIGPGVVAALADLFAGVPRFSFSLDRVRWFGDAVVWLGPSDDAPFRALTALTAAAYPSCPPCGQHREPDPHLTIGHGGPAEEMRAAAAAVAPLLPITAEATEVTLMTGPEPGPPSEPPPRPPGQWATIASFPLGAPAD
jgi:2'-5' RNA ligase